MRSLAIVCVACLVSSAAFAQDTAPAKAAKPVKEQKICRSDVPTGSMMAKSTCHTATEWQAIDEQTARDTERQLDARGRSLQGLSH
jgi:hypothetical protein